MSLSGTISTTAGSPGNKDLVQAYQPLLLATITFIDGAVLRLSTHPLNTAEGGFQYLGNDYIARLLDQNIDAVQAMSDTGIDIPPTMALKIADADKYIWTNYELGIGFKGATLNLDLVLWEADTANYSSDSYRKFTGICDPALIDELTCTVSARSKMNMQQVMLPLIQVQQRCPWIFPPDAPSRADGLSNPDSPYYPCGYSADQAGGVGNNLANGGVAANQTDATGNPLTDSSGNFLQCDYTRAGCDLRGMFSKDSRNQQTGHFGGVEWDPPLWWKGKAYLTGLTVSGINATNDQLYNNFIPLVYGQVFVNGVVLDIQGDANSTRMEVLLCFGNVGNGVASTGSTGGVKMVILNGVAVPYNFAQVGGPGPADALLRWQYVNYGNRTSMANTDAGFSNSPGTAYSGLGDPFGNLTVIEVVVPTVLCSSQTLPTVQILAVGPAVRVWYASDPGGGLTDSTVPGFYYLNVNGAGPPVFDNRTSALSVVQCGGNPIWVLMDALIRAGWSYDELNIQSFINAAAVCGTQIYFTNNAGTFTNGNMDGTPHARYSCSLGVAKRRTAADIIQGIRNSCKAMLVPNDSTGLLQVFIKQTLGDQQPSPITGSNFAGAIASVTALSYAADGSSILGAVTEGYSAYDFDETSILASNNASTLKITQRRVVDSPNSLSTNFQDQDNQFVVDSMTELDPVDTARAGQTIGGSLVMDGLNSYDQGQRVFEGRFAETFRGNPRGDSGGTLVFEFQTTQKVAHLQVGDICRFSYQQMFLSLQTVRVIAIQPSVDYETAKVTLQWHEDQWYTDTYGQQGQPIYSGNNKQALPRPPFPWAPYTAAPLAGDSIYDPSDWTFGMQQMYSTGQDGSPMVSLQITGVMPVNSFATLQAPILALTGAPSTGGSYYLAPAQVLYAVVCPYDGNTPPNYAPPQLVPCVTSIPPGGSSDYQITIPVGFWPPGTVGWSLFVGPNAMQMTLQASGTGTPSTITFGGFSGSDPFGDPPPSASTPASSSLNIRTIAPPDVNWDHNTVEVTLQVHGGVFGRAINALTATTIQIAGALWTTNQWEGYDFTITYSVLAANSPQPVLNFRVASNTADTLTIDFLATDHGAWNLPDLGVSVGDVLVMRAKPSTFTALTIGDANFVNDTTPSQPDTTMGLVVNEGNYVLRIFAGTGKGQKRNVVSNTTTVYTVDQPFDPVPDATSRFWIEESTPLSSQDSASLQNSKLTTGMLTINVAVPNYGGESVVVEAFTVDAFGNTCFEQYAPVRDYYIVGAQGTQTVSGNYSMLPTDRILDADANAGPVVITMLPFSEIPNQSLFVQKTDTSTNPVSIATASSGDLINGIYNSMQLVAFGDSILIVVTAG